MLQGSFDTVSFDEVLGFLASSSKTGVLRISGDRGTGSVWVQDGKIVAAETTQGGEDPTLEEVVFELLRFASGSFAFEFDETSPNASSPMEIESVLTQANKLLVEWRGIELVVPGLDHRIIPTPSLPSEQVTVTADEWTTLLAVGSNSSVEEVTNSLHLGQVEGFRRLKGLIERKIVLITDPQTPQVSDETEMDTTGPKSAQPKASAAKVPAPEAADAEDSAPAPAPKAEAKDDAAAPTEKPLTFEAPEVTAIPAAPAAPEVSEVPPPVAPSARRLSAKRAEAATKSKPAVQAPASVFDAPAPAPPPAPAPSQPAAPAVAAAAPAPTKVEESMSDPFAEGESRPPIPPPPPMPSAPVPSAPAVSAEVPPPPAPPSPAEIAKFGTSVEDASTIDEALVDSGAEPAKAGESSLLMRYLQSEG